MSDFVCIIALSTDLKTLSPLSAGVEPDHSPSSASLRLTFECTQMRNGDL